MANNIWIIVMLVCIMLFGLLAVWGMEKRHTEVQRICVDHGMKRSFAVNPGFRLLCVDENGQVFYFMENN